MVTYSRKIWKQPVSVNENDKQKLAEELNVSELFIEICFQRGLTTKDKIEQFINVDETWFHDPFLLHDMDRAVERITEAIENFEQITVYGDYDADGMTSTALITESLESLGANVNYFLPSRFKEGYGPNIQAFEQIIEEGTSLIITVDNGVAGHEAIKHANELGADVIVTDHHELQNTLPEAYAIIHPKHPAGAYPFGDLAGVGVALKLAHALTDEMSLEALELAAIGTVADLVPLVGENRALVFYGLKMIQQTQRIGLLELLKVIDKNPTEVTEETIGFQIAPRLNAVGRLGEASPCVELLNTHDSVRAKELVQFVDDQNNERKAIVENMTKDVLQKLEEADSTLEVIVLADEEWHQGVLGIVASRVVELTNKPTLLFNINPETRIATGSGRSIEGFDLFMALEKIAEQFVQFGGHSMAAGMSAEVTQLDRIQKDLSKLLAEMDDFELVQSIDATLSLEEITTEAIKELNQLSPFGTANEKPLIATEKVKIMQKRGVGVDGAHLKLVIGQGDQNLDIISFSNGFMTEILFEEQEVAVAGYLDLNVWNGNTKPQLQMLDISLSGAALIDERLNHLSPKNFQKSDVEYVFYDPSVYEQSLKMIPDTSTAVLLSSLDKASAYKASREMVIVDCPLSIEIFEQTILGNESKRIRCYFYKASHLFLSGLPTREEFVKAYKFFRKHKDINLQEQGSLLSRHLNLDNNKIYLIVKVFLEAKFVIIDDGVLNAVEHPHKQDILQTKSYQEAQKQFHAEELFIYSSFNQVAHSLN